MGCVFFFSFVLLCELTYTMNEIEIFWREKKFDCERMIGKIILLILILIYPISDNVPNRCFAFYCWATNRWWWEKRRASEHERQMVYVNNVYQGRDESEREEKKSRWRKSLSSSSRYNDNVKRTYRTGGVIN